ncbi:tyrosine--tRNA ligase [Tuanshanicoccus lijuaniae]|uniref:tyrosine--tRNA ligase n=1 Tax=Aerococcaceae bacterium zg-1292 TaxID=2774330 RepID=UPI001935BB76|nr:tyrosine--tRNA ligase [Aerococcaceae bacterium zg-1292]MBS4456921.1 tyrosine--tRNA ligase [Aerococcaceae bacterium zg-A91]MBS4458860.1 tyrosine--tRNA ligase [Aerococcaceae bacterium zg-BR33]QQA36977.1 tyrosine--tRNA ligase [Aerococcaceae bacterium zg-1292]
MSIIEELEWRGAINQQTDAEGLRKLTTEKSIGLYCGVDPTGDSMHIGHLIPFMVLKRFQLAGHQPVVLIGGATGSIGDPSGRTSERTLQTMETVNENARKLAAQMDKLFLKGDVAASGFRIVNNHDWLSEITLLDFLRDYGKHFNINTMLAKDVVASRLENGISFTEFSYQILQSIDFAYLHEHHDVQLQVGGADQWGNITSGLDYIRRTQGHEEEVYGLTIPLMLKSDGTKFGKTAGGAVWLDAEKTTPYEFYQFWLNQADDDVVKFLKYFTFLSKAEIDALEQAVKEAPHERLAQRTLAEEITKFVHGEKELEEAQHITAALFSGDIRSLTEKQIETGLRNMPQFEAPKATANLAVWLVDTGIVPSRRQAREFISNGAISLNGEKITDVEAEVSEDLAIGGKYIVVRRGKKQYYLVTLVD